MSQTKLESLNRSIFDLLQMNIAIHQLNKHYEQHCGLSIVQWCLLKHLVDLPGTPANALAHAIGVQPSTLTQSLRRLSRKKLLFVMRDPKDSRKKILSITREGKERLDQSEARLTEGFANLDHHSVEIRKISQYLAHQASQARRACRHHS